MARLVVEGPGGGTFFLNIESGRMSAGDRAAIDARLAYLKLPAEYRAIPGEATLTRAQVASLMMEATKAVTGRFTGYQGPVGGGTRGARLEQVSPVSPSGSPPVLRVEARTGRLRAPVG